MAKNKSKKTEQAKAEPENLTPLIKLDFNVWFAMREKQIPSQHLREILWADFKARGLTAKETLQTYDEALATYGVKL